MNLTQQLEVAATCGHQASKLEIAKRIQSRFPSNRWEESKASAFYFVLRRNLEHVPGRKIRKKITRDVNLSSYQLDKIIGQDATTIEECIRSNLK